MFGADCMNLRRISASDTFAVRLICGAKFIGEFLYLFSFVSSRLATSHSILISLSHRCAGAVCGPWVAAVCSLWDHHEEAFVTAAQFHAQRQIYVRWQWIAPFCLTFISCIQSVEYIYFSPLSLHFIDFYFVGWVEIKWTVVYEASYFAGTRLHPNRMPFSCKQEVT